MLCALFSPQNHNLAELELKVKVSSTCISTQLELKHNIVIS